jgi:hypothetical protein
VSREEIPADIGNNDVVEAKERPSIKYPASAAEFELQGS